MILEKLIGKERIRDFVLKQHCIPWKAKIAFNKLYSYRYLFFNINTKDYWDKVWSSEIDNTSCKKRRLDSLYSQILTLLPENSRLLDVGCGIGVFLQKAKAEKNCNVFGIDISETSIGFIKSKGLEGLVSKIPPIPLESNSFDAVVAIQLLEHVRSPLRTMQELLRVTKTGGLCLISVPDNCLLPHEEVEHNHYFTEKKLKAIILGCKKNIKYRILSIKEVSSNLKRLLAVCEKVS